jgi:hypothetical protein
VIGLLLSSCSDDEPDRAAASADSPVAEASETDDTGDDRAAPSRGRRVPPLAGCLRVLGQRVARSS